MKNLTLPLHQVILWTFILLFSLPAFSQTLTCNDIKNGVFLWLSKADGSKSVYTRTGGVQKEFVGSTRATILWDVEWVSDCAYTLQYNSGLEDLPKKELEAYRKHKIYCQIAEVNNDFYVFENHLDKISNPVVLKDTLWIKQRKDAKNKTIVNPGIDSILAIKKNAYDSSLKQAAFLYIYRPHRIKMMLAVCDVFLNGEIVCKVGDNSAYIVRIMKEGPANIVAKLYGSESTVSLNVRFGEKYFLRCDALWSIPGHPALTKSNQEEAKPYFDKIK